MRKGNILLTCLILFSSLSCIDEIRLKIDANQKQLAIEGLIADRADTYQISVRYSAVIGVGNDNVLEPISGAEVTVFDDAGNSFEFLESDPGIYIKEMRGEVGRHYHTEILLSDKTMVKSEPLLLLKAPDIDSIQSEVTEQSFLNSAGNITTYTNLILRLDTHFDDFVARPFLRWRSGGEFEFKENYPGALNTKTCYVEDRVDLNNLKIFDTRTLSGNQIFQQEFINTPLDYRFAFQYCFHVSQYTMTEEEYVYWRAVNAVINIDGSLFDPPPGTVRGNLTKTDNPDEIVLGFFSVCGVSYRRFWANPQSLRQVYIEPKCVNGRFRPVAPDCRDCTDMPSSSLQRPLYWKP